MNQVKFKKKESLKTSFEELEFHVNFLIDTGNYPPAISEFFLIEIKKIKEVLTLSKNIIFENEKHEQEINEKEIISNKKNNVMRNTSNEKEASINKLNEQEIALSDVPNEKEIKDIQKTKLENRTFFFYGEKLSQGEDQFTEFKYYPNIDRILRQNLVKQYLGFLNAKGGFIYIGVTDLKEVKGIYLDYKQRDIQGNDLLLLTNNFYPNVRVNNIEVSFIPVRNSQTNEDIPDLYVIKIHISAGDPTSLYIAGNTQQGMFSAIRRQTQVLNLTLEEIYTEIIRRRLLNKKWLEIIDTHIEKSKLEQQNEAQIKIVRKCGYKLKITNIDKELKTKDINRQFNNCGCKVRRFKGINGKTIGEGYIIFDDKEKARRTMEFLEVSNLGGKIKLKMELEKYYNYYNKYKN